MILVLIVGITASIVGVHSKVVAETMGEESDADSSLEQLSLGASQDTQFQQAFDGNSMG